MFLPATPLFMTTKLCRKLPALALTTSMLLLAWGYNQTAWANPSDSAQTQASLLAQTEANAAWTDAYGTSNVSTSAPALTPAPAPAQAFNAAGLGSKITLKAGAEGAYVHTIQNDPVGAPSNDRAGKHGPGGGGGLLLEARFLRFIGLETALLYETNTRTKEIEINESYGTISYFPKVTADNLRIPILLKGVLSMPVHGPEEANVWIGAGPEFVIPMSVESEITYEVNSPYNVTIDGPSQARIQAQSDNYNARTKEKSAVHLAVGTGCGLQLGPVELGFAARASWNFGHENDYVQHLCLGNQCMADKYEYSEHTLDLRAMLRLLYIFPIL